MTNHLRYNMHGHLIEYNKKNRSWTWSKWEAQDNGNGKEVVRHSGPLQFKKLFRAVVEGGSEPVQAQTYAELEDALQKQGMDFIFLFQGQTRVEKDFKTTRDAELFYDLENCPHWGLTDYWFGFNRQMGSWAMYDAFTGSMQFTPQAVLNRRDKGINHPPARSRPHTNRTAVYRDAGNTVH